jgi:hypothetical protein
MRKLTKFKQDEVYASPTNAAGLYVVITRLDKKVYIFDEAFIHLIRYALATFCTSEMSPGQLAVFLNYIDAFNGGTPFTSVTRALDDELLNIGLSVEDGSLYACGEALFFTFAPNGADINL